MTQENEIDLREYFSDYVKEGAEFHQLKRTYNYIFDYFAASSEVTKFGFSAVDIDVLDATQQKTAFSFRISLDNRGGFEVIYVNPFEWLNKKLSKEVNLLRCRTNVKNVKELKTEITKIIEQMKALRIKILNFQTNKEKL